MIIQFGWNLEEAHIAFETFPIINDMQCSNPIFDFRSTPTLPALYTFQPSARIDSQPPILSNESSIQVPFWFWSSFAIWQWIWERNCQLAPINLNVWFVLAFDWLYGGLYAFDKAYFLLWKSTFHLIIRIYSFYVSNNIIVVLVIKLRLLNFINHSNHWWVVYLARLIQYTSDSSR